MTASQAFQSFFIVAVRRTQAFVLHLALKKGTVLLVEGSAVCAWTYLFFCAGISLSPMISLLAPCRSALLFRGKCLFFICTMLPTAATFVQALILL